MWTWTNKCQTDKHKVTNRTSKGDIQYLVRTCCEQTKYQRISTNCCLYAAIMKDLSRRLSALHFRGLSKPSRHARDRRDQQRITGFTIDTAWYTQKCYYDVSTGHSLHEATRHICTHLRTWWQNYICRYRRADVLSCRRSYKLMRATQAAVERKIQYVHQQRSTKLDHNEIVNICGRHCIRHDNDLHFDMTYARVRHVRGVESAIFDFQYTVIWPRNV